ncbi:3'-5' exonuclease [Candidatus Pacearchaeota archaeon]|nr:3'-5' exonuclease [Candidatus Pacearchaeota archaeon]
MTEIFLFTDTETTGFRKSGALVQAGQARVCQSAMILTDDAGKTLAEFSCLIKPVDWIISNGAEKCHGISQQNCEVYGISQEAMIQTFFELARKSTMIVAHNASFDRAMMDIEAAYYHRDKSNTSSAHQQWFCTQSNSTSICCIPPTQRMQAAGRNHYKTPSLAEALFHFTGRHIEGAHDAMVDARACRDVFFAMRGVQIAT